ncbi:MAG: HD-GYP domain-containing protein [Deltaproteobacteria bacterium]|nr:HD-GYP domain-containing protein [Deltaproteobacteria bacterium]
MALGNIHKLLFRNLVIGGVVIATLAGGLVTFIELNRIDKHVLEISLIKSEKILKYYEKFYINRTDKSLAILKRVTKNNLDLNSFIFVEFLDDKNERVAQVSIKEFHKINSQLNSRFGGFQMTGGFEHKTIYFNNQVFIKVMLPIFSKSTGKNLGHFQGIYHLSEDKLNKIKDQSYYSILLTIIAVLFTTILIYPIIFALHKKLISRSFELLRSNTNILKSFGSAIAERDSDTNLHNYRVTIYSVKLAEKIGLGKPQIMALIKGAFLHDVGKIGISDTILLKPGKLTDKEFETMKQHVAIGAKIIKYNDWLKDAVDVIQYHHEKFDGSGYLSGLKDKDIPVNAKIFAISDVFDALTSKRPYKKPFSIEKSMQIMKEDSGKHFEPEFLKTFEQIAGELYTQIGDFEDEERLDSYLDLIAGKYFTIRI